MKFCKVINIYLGDTLQRLKDGTLRLQPGQWVRCGPESSCSRWIGITINGTMIVAHPKNNVVNNKRFQNNLSLWRGKREKR